MARCAVLCLAVLCALAASAQPAAAAPPTSPAFGTVSAATSVTTQLRQNLTVAAVESGKSTAPIPVQQAFLSSTQNQPIAGGNQTVSMVCNAILMLVCMHRGCSAM